MFEDRIHMIQQSGTFRVTGRVTEVTGYTVIAQGLSVPVGAMARVSPRGVAPIDAQVVGFRNGSAILMPLTEPRGVREGDRITSSASMQMVPVGRQMLGRVIDGMGNVVHGGDFTVESQYPVFSRPPKPLDRNPIDHSIATGIRSIDSMLTFGGGQRMGVFAGTGVGKSVLMGMIARNTSADVTVVALVGERGREVGDFLRKDLGEEGAKKSVMVVSTSDESPVLRVRACFVATAVAEYFRDMGLNVLLMMDSTTRMAMAQREIGLAAGEPPATKGYPPSAFSMIPRLLERAGKTEKGSITGLYTVLVEGDDINEPVADAVRGTLDGHVWLSRRLANRGHYPAVSVLDSISRVMPDVTSDDHQHAAQSIRRILATWDEIEDLVNIGAYTEGANVDYDVTVRMKPKIDTFLQQSIHEQLDFDQTVEGLQQLSQEIEDTRTKLTTRQAAIA